MPEFIVTAQEVKNKAMELRKINAEFKKTASDLEGEQTRLNTMWEGDAHDNFDMAYKKNKVHIENFYNAIENYAQTDAPSVGFYEAGSNYEKIIEAENQVSDTAPEFEYTPVTEEGYEAPEEFVIGGETVNEEVKNPYSDLTKEEEEFLAALMQQQKEDANEVSKSL